MLVHVPGHLMTSAVTDVLLLERLVPDRGVAVKRAAERDVERHRVVNLVRERVDLGVVDLVRVELLHSLALLRMPKLVEDRGGAQPSQLPVVCEAPRKRREISIVAPEPVAAELPRSIREDVDHLQVAEPHDEVASDVPSDVQDQEQPNRHKPLGAVELQVRLHSGAQLHGSRVPRSSFKLRPVQENTGRQQKCAAGGMMPLSRASYSPLLSPACCDVSSSSPMMPSPSSSSKST